MKIPDILLLSALFCALPLCAQNTFTVTGTTIPAELLKLNYGSLPQGIQGLDLNICNTTDARHPVTSSEIFQALSQSQASLRPIGRQIMLAVILRKQNHSLRTWLSLGFNSTSSVLSVLGASHVNLSPATISGASLGAVIGQQLLSAWSPGLTVDQVEKFEAQVLESALVMDGGSCVERTVFTASAPSKKTSKQPVAGVEIHIR